MASQGSTTGASRWAVLASVCTGLWVIALNTTAINTAVGAIADDLDISTSTLSWAINAYVLAAAAFVVIGGQVGDVIGRKRVFLLGLVVFAIGSTLNAAAPSGAFLIAGRATQGLGSALMMPATMAIISAVFPTRERGTALGIWGAVGGLGFSIGPLYGGVFADLLSWRLIFVSDYLWLGLGAVMTLRFLRALPADTSRARVDKVGAPLLVAGLFLLVLGVQQGGNWGWTSPAILVALAGAAVALGTFFLVEHRESMPMIHFDVFRNGRFVAGNLTTFVNAMGLFGLLYFFNLWAQAPAVLDLSAVQSSVLLLPYGATMLAFSLVGGRVADRFGYALPLGAGFASMAAGFVLLARVTTSTTSSELILPLALAGIGVGITFSTSSAAGMAAVPPTRAGEASGVINMFRYLGGVFIVAVGTLLYVGVATERLDDSLTDVGVADTEQAALDRALVSSTEDFEDAERPLTGAERSAFERGAGEGITDGFRRTAWLSAAASVLAALSSVVLFRRRLPEVARVRADDLEAAAGLADPNEAEPA